MQTVNIPTVSIDCVSCRELNVFTICGSQIIKLLGTCQNCNGDVNIQWQVQQENGTVLVLDKTTTTTGNRSANLVLKEGSLLDGQIYHFELNITMRSTGLTGHSRLTLHPSLPPSDGLCDVIHPGEVTAVHDFIYVKCSGITVGKLYIVN